MYTEIRGLNVDSKIDQVVYCWHVRKIKSEVILTFSFKTNKDIKVL